MDDSCAVCAETLEWVAYGPCGHRDVCSTCVVRLRFVMDDKKCCICKTVCPSVFVTKALGEYTRVVNDFSVFPTGVNEGKSGDFWYHEDSQAYFDDADHYKMIRAMCRLSCSVCDNAEDQVALAPQAKRRSKFRSIDQLKGHLFHVHRLHMCNLCLEGRKVFICEQKLYSRSQLTQHMKTGDSEVDGSEVERSGFAGHPMCEFCKSSFYGDNELYTHMSREHYSCHICQRQHPGQYDYFRNYDDLELHFRKDHFLCEDEACLAKKFVVFPSEAELKRHNAMEHGGRMSRAQRNAALQIPTSFIYRRNEQDQQRGRGSLQSLSVGSSSGGAEVGSRTARVLEQLSFPPLSDPDIPDTRVDSVPDEISFPSLSEQQSRYALALNQSARGAARLGDESLFPPLPGSSNNRGPASAQQGLQSLAKSTLAARLQQRSKGPVKVLNTARPRPSENPELLPSSTQTWPTPDQGLLLPGSSQLRIGTQATRENGFMPAASSNSAWNPVAPNKIKHSVSTPNLVSGGSSGQASSSTAYGSNRSQEQPQGSQALPVAEDVRAANKSLVERMRSALGMDEDRYSAFKEIAGEYRQGIIDTSEYLSYVEQFGLSHLVPEMSRLLPDPQKQRELADAYYTNIRFKSLQENGGGGTSSQEASCKRKGKGKVPVTESGGTTDVKYALADNFLDTVRRLQSNHQAQEGEAEVLSKDGYRPSKGVQLSAGSSSSLDSDTGFNSKASGARDNAGKGGNSSSNKQPKKTSKFLRARLGDNSLATLDLSRPSASPEGPERESQGPQMGLPVRGAWKNGGGQKLFSSNGRK
ncbi:E3 ubiquitin-protein ligase ZNF598-like isoform X2 [Panicum virgatum]|uniref:E3 ubiquitin-protein ligase ZNF598-like isoform X2 n=1 Tax=Panicum virgatum TaxID=38727 RepID=UPI0019D5234E|nr:E3 ubiquitin-protein ligase ZNF598-like isoform X2 [Panicum virgatum]